MASCSALPRPRICAGIVLALLLAAAAAAPPEIRVNGQALSAGEITRIEQLIAGRLQPGRYWYDRTAGLWGYEGGPTAGFALAGLAMGGPLHAEASGGGTRVFINGRELHPREVQYLATLGPVWPGRYWLSAAGYVGYEGQARPFAHLPSLHAQRYGSGGGTTPGGASIATGEGCISISARSSSGIGSWGASNC